MLNINLEKGEFVMATFNVGIGEEDIQEPILMPEDWYVMEINKEPYEDKNKAWKDAGESLNLEEASKINEKAGKNIVLQLKVVSDVPEYAGRVMTKWLSLPNPNDEGQYMNNGQPKADWKASVIFTWAKAFGGMTEGEEVSFGIGQKALVYIIQGADMDGEGLVNEISMNVDPRPISEATEGGLSGGDDSNPFDSDLL